MPFSEEAYAEMEEAVGPENISKDPAVLDSYACHATYLGVPAPGMLRGIWWNRASAVVLPGSTEEVQQIVQICNKYKIRYKAHSTGQYPPAFPQDKDGITIDLRRMNRIIEINEENMYALVEPYVTQAEIFVECMRHGMVPHMIDAGASISPLASITSVGGNGDSSISRGYNERNGLGLEWVLPTGELVRLGSPMTPNAGWFSGDGPGPSLLGAIRGETGAFGTRGIFTKVAIKLYPWHGPKEFEHGDQPPWFDIKQDWPFSKVIIVKWDNYKREADGLYLIGEAEIFDSFGRLSTTKTEAIVAETKNEWARIRRADFFGRMFPKGGWFGHIVAANQAHFEYCVKALVRIAEKTGAVIIDPDPEINSIVQYGQNVVKSMTEYIPKEFRTPEFINAQKQGLFQMIVLKDFTLKACEMPMAGTVGPVPASIYLTTDKMLDFIEKVQVPTKKKYQKQGKMLDDGPDGCWCTIDEGGHMFQYMNFTRIEPLDPNYEGLGLTLETALKTLKWGIPLLAAMPPPTKMAIWSKYIQRLEESLDPNETRDPHVIDALIKIIDGGDKDVKKRAK